MAGKFSLLSIFQVLILLTLEANACFLWWGCPSNSISNEDFKPPYTHPGGTLDTNWSPKVPQNATSSTTVTPVTEPDFVTSGSTTKDFIDITTNHMPTATNQSSTEFTNTQTTDTAHQELTESVTTDRPTTTKPIWTKPPSKGLLIRTNNASPMGNFGSLSCTLLVFVGYFYYYLN